MTEYQDVTHTTMKKFFKIALPYYKIQKKKILRKNLYRKTIHQTNV